MNEQQVQIKDTEIVNDFLLIQWTDETDFALFFAAGEPGN